MSNNPHQYSLTLDVDCSPWIHCQASSYTHFLRCVYVALDAVLSTNCHLSVHSKIFSKLQSSNPKWSLFPPFNTLVSSGTRNKLLTFNFIVRPNLFLSSGQFYNEELGNVIGCVSFTTMVNGSHYYCSKQALRLSYY